MAAIAFDLRAKGIAAMAAPTRSLVHPSATAVTSYARLRAIARSILIYDAQVAVALGVFPLSTRHVDNSVHRGRVRPEVHGKTAPIGDLVKKVPNGTPSLESSTWP